MILRFFTTFSVKAVSAGGELVDKVLNKGQNRHVVSASYTDLDRDYCNITFDDGDVVFGVSTRLFELREGKIDEPVEIEPVDEVDLETEESDDVVTLEQDLGELEENDDDDEV